MQSAKILIDAAIKCGASNAAVIRVSDIPFHREFRAACEQNTCGKFGKCWMCPPDIGDADELISDAKSFAHALIMQTVDKLEDSYDIEGMQNASINHNALVRKIPIELEHLLPGPVLKLGAGGCHTCPRCAKLSDTPCRSPEKVVAPMEAYGISVSELASICKLNYINGQNTVTYFGAILFGSK